jgi:hypothetical protein
VSYHTGQTFGKDSPLAGAIVAEEPSDVQAQGDRYLLPWKVGE